MNREPDSDLHTMRLSRRELLKLGALGAGLLTLPAFAATVEPRVPSSKPDAVVLGHWTGGATLARVCDVRAGWMPACARRIATPDATFRDELAAVDPRGAAPGVYRLRIIGAETIVPLRVVADYGHGNRHGLWQAWHDGTGMQTSSPLAILWAAARGEPLPLDFMMSGGRGGRAEIPASRGIYVAVFTMGDDPPPAWGRLALRASDPARPLDLRLHARATAMAATLPYLLLAVDRCDA